MTKSIEARIDELESIEAIRKLKARYCAGCDDDHNPDTLEELFWEDAVWEATSNGRFEGHVARRGFFTGLRDSKLIRNSAHNVFNPIIEVNGDQATGHWRLVMLYTANVNEGIEYRRIIGWYKEEYERRDGEWRYKSLFCQVEENGAYSAEGWLRDRI